jgi:hypothetical protein
MMQTIQIFIKRISLYGAFDNRRLCNTEWEDGTRITEELEVILTEAVAV